MANTLRATFLLLTCVSAATLHAILANEVIIKTTYRHNGISCNKCPPGYHFINHCTPDNRNASCIPCPSGKYISYYNQAIACATCTLCDRSDRKVVYRNCTAVQDTQCRCEPGHYRQIDGPNEGVCVAHEMCPKGQGVLFPGNHMNNTVCTQCKPGISFSPNESERPCQLCSTCAEDHQILEECTAVSDTKCQLKVKEVQGLPGGAIAGIICGVVFVLVLILIGAVLCARRGQGPRVTQNLYNKYCRKGSNKNGKAVTNGYKYTPQGALDDMDHNGLSERELKLLQTFPELSRDLIHPEWKFFFRYLFEESDKYIHEAELNNQGNVREQIHCILKEWLKRDKEKATQERLVKALEQQDRMDLVQKYFSSPTHPAATTITATSPLTDSDSKMTEV